MNEDKMYEMLMSIMQDLAVVKSKLNVFMATKLPNIIIKTLIICSIT